MFYEFKFLPKPFIVCIVMVLSLALVLQPMISDAYGGNNNKLRDDTTACEDAEKRARLDINTGQWFFIGFFAGILGYIIANQESNPPATPLVGKSEEYVAAYTDCYRAKSKEIKSKNAFNGCLTFVVSYAVLIVILVSSIESDLE